MRRGRIGTWRMQHVDGESVRAFRPEPLPPSPALHLDDAVRDTLNDSLLALGRLDSVSIFLTDHAHLSYAFVRAEAVSSAHLDGSQASLADLFAYEASVAPGGAIGDVRDVASGVAALDWALSKLRMGFPLSSRLLRGVHEQLLATSPGAAIMPAEVVESMNALERFLHDLPERTPPLIKAALAHAQLHAIHPFPQGNGRVGRLLIALLLCAEGLLQEPLLYLSRYLEQHRSTYDALLTQVRDEGEWEAWLEFFATGVRETAAHAVHTAQRSVALFHQDRERIQQIGRTAGTALRVYDALRTRPIDKAAGLSARAGVSMPTTNSALEQLQAIGLVRELTGRKRDRAFSYPAYIALLSEDLAPR